MIITEEMEGLFFPEGSETQFVWIMLKNLRNRNFDVYTEFCPETQKIEFHISKWSK